MDLSETIHAGKPGSEHTAASPKLKPRQSKTLGSRELFLQGAPSGTEATASPSSILGSSQAPSPEAAATVPSFATNMAAVADLGAKCKLSTTSPEMDPVQVKDDTSKDKDHNLVLGIEQPQPEPCLRGVSSGTAVVSSYLTASYPAIAHSDSFTSPETDAVKEQSGKLKDDTLAKPDPVLTTTPDHTDDIHEASPGDIPRVADRLAQPRGSPRPFIISPRFHARIPNPPNGELNVRNGEARQSQRAQQGPQANPAGLQVPGPTVNMKEAGTHILGGLVEETVGCIASLFARQVPGDDISTPYGTWKIERHHYMTWPQPDMGPSNKEFDEWLESLRTIFEPWDEEFIESFVGGYAKETTLFQNMIEEHLEELSAIYESFLSIQKSLSDLNETRESAKSDALLRPPRRRLNSAQRTALLAMVAESEEQLKEQLDLVKQDVRGIIRRSCSKLEDVLVYDFGGSNAVNEYLTKARLKQEAEEEFTEFVISGAMLGLRGRFKDQDEKTQNVILEHTKLAVEEMMKGFGQPYQPGKFDSLASNLDTLITTVPEWFSLLELKGTVELHGATAMERYRELVQVLGRTSVRARDEQRAAGGRPKKPFTKEFHYPDPGWPSEKQRLVGGWWACRSGPNASPAEIRCKLCHPRGSAERATETIIYPSAADEHKYILAEVEKAMAEANQRDRLRLKHKLQQDKQDYDSYWQQRAWRRSGGGLELQELLYGMGVNELNHQPLIQRSQSWHIPGFRTQSQGAVSDKGVDDNVLPAQRRLSEPIQSETGPHPEMQKPSQAPAVNSETPVQAELPPWSEVQRLFPTHERIEEGQRRKDREPLVQEDPPVQSGPAQATEAQTTKSQPQLRSAMARPGQKGERKSVVFFV